MELEFFDFPVQNVVFGEKTALEGTVLTINREEMARQIDPDGFFSDVQIDIARPGEAVRIINIMDVMQPRCKESDAESPYPGMFSSMQLAGTGRTYVLQGVSVMQTGRRQGIQEGIIDMSGPGAAYSLFSSLCNVVLRCTPADPNASNSDFDAATRKSLLAAALYLGNTARGQQPGSVRTFSTDTPVEPHLRKVVYIYYLQSQGPLRNTFLYGKDVTSLLPTLLHPNEVMDGAIVSGNYIIAGGKWPYRDLRHQPVFRLNDRRRYGSGRSMEAGQGHRTWQPCQPVRPYWLPGCGKQPDPGGNGLHRGPLPFGTADGEAVAAQGDAYRGA